MTVTVCCIITVTLSHGLFLGIFYVFVARLILFTGILVFTVSVIIRRNGTNRKGIGRANLSMSQFFFLSAPSLSESCELVKRGSENKCRNWVETG